MRNHDYAESLGKEHPAILGLSNYLKKRQVPKQTIEFLGRRVFFAYPRTLWIKLAVDIADTSAEKDMSFRHSLDPVQTGKAVDDWLIAQSSINKIVFDLTDVTIFDAKRMLGLFNAIHGKRDGGKFYVCEGDMVDSLHGLPEATEKTIFPSEKSLLSHLRDVPTAQRCIVELPKDLNLLSLDEALRCHASSADLRNCDVVAFDMSKVMSISFEAHSMFSPIIHSLAHSHGILATVLAGSDNLRTKILREIMSYGTFRAMRSNLIQVPQDYIKRLDPPASDPGVFSMRTFTRDESVQVKELCMQRLDEMLRYYMAWLANVAKIPPGRYQNRADNFFPIVVHLRNVINELIDNVAYHAYGIGYVMMELNPRPERGLSIYVGDTGVGLARGLAKSYHMKRPTNLAAVKMAIRRYKRACATLIRTGGARKSLRRMPVPGLYNARLPNMNINWIGLEVISNGKVRRFQ